jgi:hypothetical protein
MAQVSLGEVLSSPDARAYSAINSKRVDLGRARDDLPALGQAKGMDRGRARVSGLENRPRSGASGVAGDVTQFEE